MPDSFDKSEFNKSYINLDWAYVTKVIRGKDSMQNNSLYNEFIFQKIKLPINKKLIFSGYFYNNYFSFNNSTLNDYDTLSNERILVTLDTINPIINLNKQIPIDTSARLAEADQICRVNKNDFGNKIIYSFLPELKKWKNIKSKPFTVNNESNYLFISMNTDRDRLIYDSLRIRKKDYYFMQYLLEKKDITWLDSAMILVVHQIQLDNLIIRESYLGLEGSVNKINPCLGDIVTFTYKVSQDDIDSIFDASFYCILDKGLRYISGDFININGQLVCNISKEKFDKEGNYFIHFDVLVENNESNVGKYLFSKIYPMNFDTTKIKSLGRYAVELMPVKNIDITKEVVQFSDYVCDNQRLHIRYKITNNSNVNLSNVDFIFQIETYSDSLKKYIKYNYTKDTTYDYYNSYDYQFNPDSRNYAFLWEFNGIPFKSFTGNLMTNNINPPPYFYFDEEGCLHIRTPLNSKPVDNQNYPDTNYIDIYYRIPKDLSYVKIRITDSTNFNGEACNLLSTQHEFEIKRTSFSKKMIADTTTCEDNIEINTGYPNYLNIWEDDFVGYERRITKSGVYKVKIIDTNNCFFIDSVKVTFDTTRQNWATIKLSNSKIVVNNNSQFQVLLEIPNDRAIVNNYSHYSYDVTFNKNYIKFINFINSQQISENDSLITIRITDKLNNKKSFDTSNIAISFYSLSPIDKTIININNFIFYDFYCSNDTTSLRLEIGIKDTQTSSKILAIDNLYPIPVSNKLNFILSTPKEALISIIIFDVLGRKVNEQYSNIPMNNLTTKISIDVSFLSSGLYYLQIIDSNHSQTVFSKFIIIQ
jgi:hypothetical protein